MSISNKEYDKMAKKASPNSPVLVDCLKAFLFGGAICCFAEGLSQAFKKTTMTQAESKTLVLTILIAITAVLTGFGVFDKIAKHAGAGTMVPITGFANSIVSPAMEFKSEGLVLGTAAKMFTIAGPVLVYGISASIVYGVVLAIFGGA